MSPKGILRGTIGHSPFNICKLFQYFAGRCS
uniref:Uncharacterized protein n=1 Tax=Arundo donax TaxID=35708 RepID=A0A0A9FLT4_ARUDO